MGQTGKVCVFPEKEEIWPFGWDFQAGKDGVGHTNLGKVQFCLLLYSENAQGPPRKSLSPSPVSESRVLERVMLDAKPWPGFLCPALGYPKAEDTVPALGSATAQADGF